MLRWKKKVVGGEVYHVITIFDGRIRKVIPRATTIRVLAILTIICAIMVLLLLGLSVFLGEVLGVPEVQVDGETLPPGGNWIAVPGGLMIYAAIGSAVAWALEVRATPQKVLRRQEEKLQYDEQMRLKEQQRRRAEESAEEERRVRIEALLRRDAVRDKINYMSGAEFEKFMAALFRQKGYEVEETPLSGDQGVDLILPDLDGKRVVIQLKRWTGPVGNAAVQATFAGMAHYRAQEGWIITTGTFTKSARELARSTSVRLINGKELADWLEGLREDA